MRTRLPFVVGLAIAVAATGCGFRLRGTTAALAPLPPVYIDGAAVTDLRDELSGRLRSGGATPAATAAGATLVVTLFGEQRDRRVLSVGAGGRVAEYELHYGVRFNVRAADGRRLTADLNANAIRDFAFDETDVVAKATEEEHLYRDMRREVAEDIVRRLQALAGTGAQ